MTTFVRILWKLFVQRPDPWNRQTAFQGLKTVRVWMRLTLSVNMRKLTVNRSLISMRQMRHINCITQPCSRFLLCSFLNSSFGLRFIYEYMNFVVMIHFRKVGCWAKYFPRGRESYSGLSLRTDIENWPPFRFLATPPRIRCFVGGKVT